MQDHYGEVSRSLFHSSEDAVVVADMKNVLNRFSALSGSLPFGKFICAANVLPRSSLLYHTLETLGTGFSVGTKDDVDFLNSMALPSSRQFVLNAHHPASFLEAAAGNGMSSFPVDSFGQINRIVNLNNPFCSAYIVVSLDDENVFTSALTAAVGLLAKCFEVGLPVIGFTFRATFSLSGASLFRCLAAAAGLINISERRFSFSIAHLFFGPEFLKATEDSSTWFPVVARLFLNANFGDHLSIYFDITNYIFINAFVLWARVKNKQQSAHTDSRLYTVSEGVFSLFGNLLAMDDDCDIRPTVVACSGFESAAPRLRCKQRKFVFKSKVCGPSGDTDIDILVSDCQLPDLDPDNDWVMINFGSCLPSGLADAFSDPLLYVVD